LNQRVAPIGVFDSGVGGLTVLRALRSALPEEDFVYLGDTARLPYGTKSADTVIRYSLQCAAALVAEGISALVVACNTVSAAALETLRSRYPHIPVFGVIEPGAAAAVNASASQHIAVIGTDGTIAGGAYSSAIRRLSNNAHIVATPCALFVALAEEGLIEGPIVEAVAAHYLRPLFYAASGTPMRDRPDALVLGCTHFPVLAAAIRAVIPSSVRIVDSAQTTAAVVAAQLCGNAVFGAMPSSSKLRQPGRTRWLATDGAERFARVGRTFLGHELLAKDIQIVDL
jgi:glutamate racemase